MVVVIVVVLLSVLLFALIVFRSWGRKNVYNAILIGLGLGKSWSKEQESPFYKWGWRKSTDDRVWGERIVRLAFEKQGVWLTADDLRYFEDLCNRHSSGERINEDSIRNQVKTILDRRGRITNCSTVILRKLMLDISATSDSEARRYLKEYGVRVSPGNPLGQYGVFRVKQLMMNAGKQILAPNTSGFPVKNEKNETLYSLQGLSGWRHWVFACMDEFKKIKPSGKNPDQKRAIQYVKARAVDGILKEASEDLQGVSDFCMQLEEQIRRKELSFDPAKIETLISHLYGWQFADGVPFNRADFRKLRDFLVLPELSPVFRSKVINRITANYHSLRTAFEHFPKRVIFYGDNEKARHFASHQYLRHLTDFITAASSVLDKGALPPGYLLIEDAQVSAARRYWQKMKDASKLERFSDRQEEVHFRRDYIPELIEKQKEFSLFERDIDDEYGESFGWIVDLGVDDLTPVESAHLDKGVFRSFLRIQCQPPESVDFNDESESAKRLRRDFFSSLMLKLEDNPLLRSRSASERSSQDEDLNDGE